MSPPFLKPRLGRLYWKLFAALWLAMIVAFGGAFAYVRAIGLQPPPPPQSVNVYLRLVPIFSAAGVSLLFSGLIAWYLARPLLHLRWGLRRAADEHFDTRVQPLMGGRRDEIVDLAIEFDRMAASLQQLTRTRRTLLHDLSHELRSPLARMQVALGLGRQNPDDAARLADRIGQEIGHLDALVEELLTLHRLESADAAGAPSPAKDSVDLVELLAAIVDDAAFESRAAGGNVVLAGDGPFIARVNGELVYRAFENVIRNAVKYSAAGTVVEVQALRQPGGQGADSLLVEVRDRGPGVPADKLEAIFEPFVRLEGPTAAVRGSGLGLAIARRAVVSQGGRIAARLRDGGGLLMRIELPADSGAGP